MLVGQTSAQTLTMGKAGSFSVSGAFVDPAGQALSYRAVQTNGSALPSWLSLDASTGVFTGTASSSASGISVVVTATDTSGLQASETVTVNVASPTAPKLASLTANQTWAEGKAVSFTLAANTFSDPLGEALTYSATQSNGSALPSWLTFNAATEKFTGTAPNTASTLGLKITATDAGGAATSENFNAIISPASAAVASLLHATAGFASAAAAAIDSAAVLNLLAPAA